MHLVTPDYSKDRQLTVKVEVSVNVDLDRGVHRFYRIQKSLFLQLKMRYLSPAYLWVNLSMIVVSGMHLKHARCDAESGHRYVVLRKGSIHHSYMYECDPGLYTVLC